MPFKLKTAGSMFARAVQNGIEPRLHRNIEAYMDDIVVKTKDKSILIQDLEETFSNLRKINMKLNPKKCVFGFPSGKLPGFLYPSVGLKQTPTRFRLLSKSKHPKPSRMSSALPDLSQH